MKEKQKVRFYAVFGCYLLAGCLPAVTILALGLAGKRLIVAAAAFLGEQLLILLAGKLWEDSWIAQAERGNQLLLKQGMPGWRTVFLSANAANETVLRLFYTGYRCARTLSCTLAACFLDLRLAAVPALYLVIRFLSSRLRETVGGKWGRYAEKYKSAMEETRKAVQEKENLSGPKCGVLRRYIAAWRKIRKVEQREFMAICLLQNLSSLLLLCTALFLVWYVSAVGVAWHLIALIAALFLCGEEQNVWMKQRFQWAGKKVKEAADHEKAF